MRDYEVTVVLNAELDEEARNELIERVSGWLKGDGEAELQVNHWGHRHLAYPIKRHKDGYYVYFEAPIEQNRIADIERNMRYADEILRTLFVRKET